MVNSAYPMVQKNWNQGCDSILSDCPSRATFVTQDKELALTEGSLSPQASEDIPHPHPFTAA